MNLHIEVLTSDGCPHGEATLQMVRELALRLAPRASVEHIVVSSLEEAERRGFAGSPTVLVEGQDVEGSWEMAPKLGCRNYELGGPMPLPWMIEAAVIRQLRPRHILFLCVNNSARSQMAEGLAKALAPSGVILSSAGSSPTSVRPEAIQVMREQGIDISRHQAKSARSIEPASVEAAITLCSEEVCPIFPRPVPRLHWELPDPAKTPGDEEARLQAFRHVRDELRRRLTLMFSGWTVR